MLGIHEKVFFAPYCYSFFNNISHIVLNLIKFNVLFCASIVYFARVFISTSVFMMLLVFFVFMMTVCFSFLISLFN